MTINSKKIALIGVLTALALISFMLESLLPPLFIPGAKLGLSNIFILVAIIFLKPDEASLLVVSKVILGSIFSGFSTFMYSAPSSMVSFLLSLLLIKYFSSKLSLIAIASISAVFNNLVQNIVFAFINESFTVLVYAPYLALLGMICGVLTGFCAYFITKRMGGYIDNILNVEK